MKKLSGIYTALLTPFTAEGKINAKVLEELVRYNLSLGADGFYVCGSTAEALMLSADERMKIMKIVKESAPSANLIAHVGSLDEREAHKLAAYAKELSYDLISSVAPFYYKFSFSEIKDYYTRLAESSGVPAKWLHFLMTTGLRASNSHQTISLHLSNAKASFPASLCSTDTTK